MLGIYLCLDLILGLTRLPSRPYVEFKRPES
jgi:hypothetical protein